MEQRIPEQVLKRLILLFFLVRHVHLIDADFGGALKETVPGDVAVLHNCSSDQLKVFKQCFLDMFLSHSINGSELPSASSDPFTTVRLDAKKMCSTYSTLRNCHKDVISDCFNYNSFRSVLNSEIDATYYVSQTAFLEFYCNYGKDFFIYYECLQAIEMDDLSDTLYEECSEVQVGTCNSVYRTTQCERAIIRKNCGHTGAMSYCQYQKILTGMTGWDYCDYMPCINSSKPRDSLICLLLFLILSISVFY